MLSLALLPAMVACDSAENRQKTEATLEETERDLERAGEKVESGLERGGEKLQKAAKDIGGDLEVSKDKFVAATRDEMRELDALIEKLKNKINSGVKSASKETSEEGREAKRNMQRELKELEVKRKDLDIHLEKVEKASQNVWQDMKKGVRDALNDLKEAASEVENKVEKN
jgi:tRNA uridine 5-carbamoylmethylation protein Kti12